MVIDLELALKLDERGEAAWLFRDPCNNDVYPVPPRVGDERWKPRGDDASTYLGISGSSTTR